MRWAKPKTPEDFAAHLRALVRAGRDREAVAYAEQFSREFLPQLSDEDLTRITAMMEGAAMIVDLEDWQASQSKVDDAPPVEAHEQALHVAGS